MLTFLKKGLLVALGPSLLISSYSVLAHEPDLNALKAEAITIVKQFGGTLKPQLKKALKEGGVKHAIEVCSVLAPNIAKELSLASQWQVKRVSLKARNNPNAIPDAWEKSTLESFDQRQQTGEKPQTIAKAEIVNHEYRFMKAQGVEPLCLTCHGSSLSEEAKAALTQYYPEDKATGYALGEIRGAFSLTKQL
jgi:hypothetical protein